MMYTILQADGRYGVRGQSCTVDDITTDPQEIAELVALLNYGEVSEIHLMEVIENWFGR